MVTTSLMLVHLLFRLFFLLFSSSASSFSSISLALPLLCQQRLVWSTAPHLLSIGPLDDVESGAAIA